MPKERVIAAISAAALMRHQNHRRIRTRPVPAPTCIMRLKFEMASFIWSARQQEANMSTTVTIRPNQTCCESLALGLMNRRYRSLTTMDDP